MSRSLQKMLNHAKSLLDDSHEALPSERIRQYQNFLKIENRRLFALHRSGEDGTDVARGRGAMMDTLLHYVFQNALKSTTPVGKNGSQKIEMCLVATGGYGRGELNPFSDVDLLFLLPSAKGPELARANATVEQVLYVLWDLGLKVGHATRTLKECIAQAGSDMQARTALIEARFLEGTKTVFTNFQKAIYEDCLQGHLEEYIRDRLRDQAERHKKYGGTVFVQEPNVKNGCGGLRDLQSLLWIARFKNGSATLDELHRSGLLAQIEKGRLARAYDFLMRVRNELHYANNRAVDEITLSAQPKIAEALGYHQKDILQRIETFMRDYYRHARDIFILSEALTERMAIEIGPSPKGGRWSRLFSFKKKAEKLEGGLVLKSGVLECTADSDFPKEPHDLMQVFRIAQLREARVGASLQSVIRGNLKLVTREFMYLKRPREIFFSILRSKGEVGRILRAMHECGFLGAYIPEFGRLDCLVQHEFYHRYTADEHTLVAIEKLDETLNATLGAPAAYSRVFQKLENPHLLYLAILMHDSGKALRERHHSDASAECARQVARRLCLEKEASRNLLWLVDNHMTMSNLAQRRDIEDPSTIEDFRQLVGTQQQLDQLHLLTFVDGQAVGSTHWNEWRQSLLWQLFDRTSNAIRVSGVELVNVETHQQRLRETVLPKLSNTISSEEVEAHFTNMPARYWHRVDGAELQWHLEIGHTFFEQLLESEAEAVAPVVRWKHYPDRAYSEVVVCSWNRHGLFAKMAGAFAAARINILNADIYTRGDDLVLDIFQVCDLEHKAIEDEARLRKMERILGESLGQSESRIFGEAIREEYQSMRHIPHQDEERFPTTVVFNNEDSGQFTILEIQTPDRLGLLYHVLQVLTDCDLDIELAKINTEKGAAMDVFYLNHMDGKKITNPERLQEIQQKLMTMISLINAPFQKETESSVP